MSKLAHFFVFLICSNVRRKIDCFLKFAWDEMPMVNDGVFKIALEAKIFIN